MQQQPATHQLTEYRTFAKGKSGCLFYLAPKTVDSDEIWCLQPAIVLLSSSCRKLDKEPFVNQLHETEKQALAEQKPILVGFGAWLIGKYGLTDCIDGYPSLTDYSDDLSFFEYRYYNEAEENSLEMELFLGKQVWKTIGYAWRNAYHDYITKLYTYPELLTEDKKFDYGKALFNRHWNDEGMHPNCYIQLNNNREIEFTGWVDGAGVSTSLVFDEDIYVLEAEEEWYSTHWGDDDEEYTPLTFEECCNRHQYENQDYFCYGFIASLLNLARNYKVYNFTTDNSFRQGERPDMQLEHFYFNFYVSKKQLFNAYVQYVKTKMIEAKEREVINPDVRQIEADIICLERGAYHHFFTKCRIAKMLSKKQAQQITDYCRMLDEYLVQTFGFDPADEVKYSQPEQLNEEKVRRYFLTNYTKQQAEQYFTILVKDGYFHPNSKLQDFLYYCGVDISVPPSAKLIWMKTQTLLAYFIHEELGINNVNDLWKITKQVFILKDCTPPNTDSMKQYFSKEISYKSKAEWENLADKLK